MTDDKDDWDIDKVLAEHRYQDEHPAFKGNLEFDLVFELFGVRVERRARIVFQYAPDWEYFDLHLGKLRKGIGGWQYHLEVLTQPHEDNGDDDAPEPESEPLAANDEEGPAWINIDITGQGVLNRKVYDALEDAIDKHCKAEDGKRRAKFLKGKN